MRNVWLIARREFHLFFISPIAYSVAFMVLLILGIIFYANILAAAFQQYPPTIQIVINPLTTLLLFTIPAVTMRTLADEQRSGTLELLLTAPVRDWELVIGKWLGAFLLAFTIIMITWIYPVILNRLIDPGIDQGLLISNYLGLSLLVAAWIAIGVAVSSLFSNQIAAYFTTIGLFLILWMIGYPSQVLGSTGGEILRYLDMSEHFFNSFFRGVIDLKDVVYYLSLTASALFLGTISIETRRWR